MRPFLAPPPPLGLQPGAAPTFSIITATYQAATTVAAAVESALGQTSGPHEVIVVDDGSTDPTQDVLAPHLDRIVYLRQANRGAAAAENAAVRRATGDFIAILDADDVYEPRRIEALAELAVQRPDLDILMTDAYLEADGRVVGRFCESTAFAVADQNVEIYERCFIAWPAVRRERLIAIGGFDESMRIAYDWECWLRLLHARSSAGLVCEPLMRYRIADDSLAGNRVAALRDRVRVLELASRLDLSTQERQALDRFLPRRRRRALLAEAEQSLREGRPDARRRAIQVAVAGGMEPIVRVKALAAALAPPAAARRLAAREARTGATRLKRGVPGG